MSIEQIKNKFYQKKHPCSAVSILTPRRLVGLILATIISGTYNIGVAYPQEETAACPKHVSKRVCKLRAQIKNAPKPKESGDQSQVCRADRRIALEWLNGHKVTKNYLELTQKIYKDWLSTSQDANVYSIPIERFLLDEVSPDKKRAEKLKTQAETQQKNTRDAFWESATALFGLAQTVAIETSLDCQNCIAIDDWGYLGWLNAQGMTNYNLGPYNIDGIMKNPNSAENGLGPEIKLSELSKNQVEKAHLELKKFRKLADLYEKSPTWDNIAQIQCKGLDYTATVEGLNKCEAEVKAWCRQKDNSLIKDNNCGKDDVHTQLKHSLWTIYIALGSFKAGSVAMTTLDPNRCQSDNNYFKYINKRKFTGANSYKPLAKN